MTGPFLSSASLLVFSSHLRFQIKVTHIVLVSYPLISPFENQCFPKGHGANRPKTEPMTQSELSVSRCTSDVLFISTPLLCVSCACCEGLDVLEHHCRRSRREIRTFVVALHPHPPILVGWCLPPYFGTFPHNSTYGGNVQNRPAKSV